MSINNTYLAVFLGSKTRPKNGTQTRRDALCPLEDSPRLRAHAAARPFWCARRVPSCRHRAEPQDLGAANPRATIPTAAPIVRLTSLMVA